jgi:hypothetical protein
LTTDIPRKRDTRCVWTPFLGAHTPKRMSTSVQLWVRLNLQETLLELEFAIFNFSFEKVEWTVRCLSLGSVPLLFIHCVFFRCVHLVARFILTSRSFPRSLQLYEYFHFSLVCVVLYFASLCFLPVTQADLSSVQRCLLEVIFKGI